MKWDDLVDVVCVGSGAGGIAAAIAAADAGHTVFVADSGAERSPSSVRAPDSAAPWVDGLRGRMGVADLDRTTTDYLDAMSEDLGPLSRCARDLEVPVRVVSPVTRDRSRSDRAVAPFYGARLRQWALECLASPYGVLYSRVRHKNMTSMRCGSGEAIEAVTIGSLQLDAEAPGLALTAWLITQARDRRIRVRTGSPLQRIVFEHGHVVGAVVATPAGPCSIRARRGLVLSTGEHHSNSTSLACSLGLLTTVEVAVVSQTASRFGRLELLTTEPFAAPRRRAEHQLHQALHARV
jgi:choline dehydrogenase-like flavoprotein